MFQYQPSDKCFRCFDCRFCGNVQIPNLPLKGPKCFEEILQCIRRAIEDEANTAEFYCHLLREAPNKLNKDYIQHAYNDELVHLEVFKKLYCYYTDSEPKCTLTPITCPCYKEGLLIALNGELATVEFYRDVQLYTMDQLIIDTFYMVMVDEQGHATMFSTLYNSLCKS